MEARHVHGEPHVDTAEIGSKVPSRAGAIFARISTGKEQQQHGLVAQIETCRQFLERLEIPLREVKVYQEEGSGRRRDRPVLRRLLRDAALHRFQILVVFRLDRLTRSGITEMFQVLKALQHSGVRVYSVNETWWDPNAPTAEVILAVISWAAQLESRVIGERVSAGIQTRKKEAERKGQPWLWGRALTSPLRRDPTLPSRAVQLREAKLSWSKTAQTLGVGRTTARRLYQLGLVSRANGTPIEEGTAEDGTGAN